jgi:hypothetical protein
MANEPQPTTEELDFEGDRTLLDGPRRALLVSRVPRRPRPATPWVRAVVKAVKRSVEAGETLITGLGRDPFDLALHECRVAGGAAVVALDAPPDAQVRALLHELAPERMLLVWPRAAREYTTREEQLWPRDRLVGVLADRAWAVEVRAGGHMEEVAAALRARGCAVEEAASEGTVEEAVEPGEIVSGAAGRFGGWDYLTHYTREPDGAWPDETRAQFLEWLARGPQDARRDVTDALRRILTMGVVLASGRLMPGQARMVSLTERAPDETQELQRWRKGLRRWDFRPYGVAVRREVLEKLGARPVDYLTEAALKRLAPRDRIFAQRHEPPKTDWAAEAEWRLPVSLRLGELNREDVRLLLPNAALAEAFARESGYQALSIG